MPYAVYEVVNTGVEVGCKPIEKIYNATTCVAQSQVFVAHRLTLAGSVDLGCRLAQNGIRLRADVSLGGMVLSPW